MDCVDPARLSRFWEAALHYRLADPPPGHSSWEEYLRAAGVPEEDWNSASAAVDPEGRGPRLYFQRVPEPKTTKNRVHLDLNVGGGPGTPVEDRRRRVDEEVERLAGLGASLVRAMAEHGGYWVVMLDPEQNEFCVQ